MVSETENLKGKGSVTGNSNGVNNQPLKWSGAMVTINGKGPWSSNWDVALDIASAVSKY
jgi:hypothetical protein